MKTYGEKSLSEALSTSKEDKNDLFNILVSSGVSCRTCYMNEKGLGWGSLFTCPLTHKFVSAPELSVCLKWRENGIPIEKKGEDK